MSKYDLTHSRHDRSICLVPGLFRSLRRGERKRIKLDVTYRFGSEETLRFVGFEQLGVDDLRLLQVIVAFAGPNGATLTAAPDAPTGRQLRRALDLKFDAIDQETLVVRECMSRLLFEIGLTDGGANIKALKASLIRMSNVTVLVSTGSREASFHMMSYAIDEDDGSLWIALNPRVSEAINGDRPHTRIDLAEVRALNSDPARLIHQRLCAWINYGKVRLVETDTLCGYVWGESANAETMKKRRQTVRRAMAELADLGWGLAVNAKGNWTISRPNSVVMLPHARSNPPPTP